MPDGAGTPILIRRRVTPLDPKARAAFVREASRSATMRLSASEQARIDAEALTPDLLAIYDPGVAGGPLAAANRRFVRGWMTWHPSRVWGVGERLRAALHVNRRVRESRGANRLDRAWEWANGECNAPLALSLAE